MWGHHQELSWLLMLHHYPSGHPHHCLGFPQLHREIHLTSVTCLHPEHAKKCMQRLCQS